MTIYDLKVKGTNGEDVSLGEPEILEWIADYLTQQYNNE